ncbi:MAG: endonuclease/exonuclease/phosphatase family protein [Clostridia bacterium]|nr:endonuclease/exonuclease/phosphatase family protein [Clostridia bacterium]
MKKNILRLIMCVIMLCTLLASCDDKENVDTMAESSGNISSASETTETNSQEESGQTIRVVSFNVRLDLQPDASGMGLKATSANRVQAVREQLMAFDADVIGLQEDVNRWVENINIDPELYTAYLPSQKMTSKYQEHCSVYVKKGITVKDSGWAWITASGSNNLPALTYSELTDNDGLYDMSVDELATLGITNNATLKSGYAGDSVIGEQDSMLESRLMNYVVLEINGKTVLYVNTHLQHRGYDGKPYSAHPLFMLRYYERCAEFDILQIHIDELKREHSCDSVILTGDFNDKEGYAFYDKVTSVYKDAFKVAQSGTKSTNAYNGAFDVSKQGQGYTAKNTANARIDYCFVSPDLENSVKKYSIGAYKWVLKKSDATGTANVTVYPSDHLPVVTDILIKK